jgi:hypothetical protein
LTTECDPNSSTLDFDVDGSSNDKPSADSKVAYVPFERSNDDFKRADDPINVAESDKCCYRSVVCDDDPGYFSSASAEQPGNTFPPRFVVKKLEGLHPLACIKKIF